MNIGDPAAAERVVGEDFGETSPRALPILLDRHEWRLAGEVAYTSLACGTASPFTMLDHLVAIRMHARTIGDFERARAVLEDASGVRWNAGVSDSA